MNIGFIEAMKDDDYDCVVFHDVDLLPEDDRLLYRCTDTPKHLSVAIDKYHYRYDGETVGKIAQQYLAQSCFVRSICGRSRSRLTEWLLARRAQAHFAVSFTMLKIFVWHILK